MKDKEKTTTTTTTTERERGDLAGICEKFLSGALFSIIPSLLSLCFFSFESRFFLPP